MQTRLLSKWKWLNVKTYNGRTDPEAHLNIYLTQTNLFSGDLHVHCRVFPTTLWRVALEWYYSLSPNSKIHSWLYALSSTPFANSKPMVVCSTLLHHIVQGDNESLRQYLARFNKAFLNILNLHPAVAMHSLMINLRLGTFLDSLYANPPKNMDVYHIRASSYISIEENAKVRKRNAPQDMMTFTRQSTKKKCPSKFESCTSLNTSRDTIF